MKKTVLYTALIGTLLSVPQANAVEFDGFLSAGLAVSDNEDYTYLNGITNDVSFDNDSKFGLQITADVSENMQGVAQILASGKDQNYNMNAQWAYLDWKMSDNFSLRMGKVKEPVFLISDYFEVGYAYPWIRPPQEVYLNNPINTIVGMQGFLTANVGGFSLNFLPYVGTNSDDVPNTDGNAKFNAENFFGGAIQLQSASFTMQASYLKTDVYTSGRIPTEMLPCTSCSIPNLVNIGYADVTSKGTAKLASFGMSWDVANFVGYAEYVTRNIEPDTTFAGAPLDFLFPDQDAWYVTLGYRFGKFLPHITAAHVESTPAGPVSTGANQGATQDSATIGLRYELNDSAALKVEYEKVTLDDSVPGNYGLLQQNASGAPIPKDVGIISVAVDVIF